MALCRTALEQWAIFTEQLPLIWISNPWITVSRGTCHSLCTGGVIFLPVYQVFSWSKDNFTCCFIAHHSAILLQVFTVNFSFYYSSAKASVFLFVLLSRSFTNTLESTSSSTDLSGHLLQHFLCCDSRAFRLRFISCLLIRYPSMRWTWPFYLTT